MTLPADCQRASVRVAWTRRDGHPRLFPLALAGVLIAGALRVFGLPPVAIHGPLHRFGVMEPSCGMTRAARYLALGHLHDAWRFNPGIFVLASAAAVILAREFIGRLTGWWVNAIGRAPRVLFYLLVGVVALLWLHQQSGAGLLS